jgi:hypothetical protein
MIVVHFEMEGFEPCYYFKTDRRTTAPTQTARELCYEPRSKALPEKLIVAQLIKKFSAF